MGHSHPFLQEVNCLESALEIINITKSFPEVIANDNISLNIKKGEIFAIVGENGAGKSTLMNIIYGLYTPDSGEIIINGKKIHHHNPKKAIDLGIGMVHQHFMLIPKFTVAENIILGKEFVKNLIFLDYEKSLEKVNEISEKFKLLVKPEEVVEKLSVGMQQRVEILKVLFRGAIILILDEPTAVLTPQETKELFYTIRTLKEQGKTVIFISHKLKEVLEIADRIAVLKNGKVIGVKKREETNERDLARMMVGRDIVFQSPEKKTLPSDVILSVENLTILGDKGVPAIKNLTFELKKGEILGIAGIEGNGQSELVEALTGLRKVDKGIIKINNKIISDFSPGNLRKSGISHIPEDRRKRGLVLPFKVSHNLILGRQRESFFSNKIFLNHKNIDRFSDNKIEEYDIRPRNKNNKTEGLSGGNQQKIIIAREVSYNPEVLIASQPTRGLDVGATEFVHKKLIQQRESGKAILLISLELDEIMMISDRIAVIYNGEFVGILNKDEATEDELGLLMVGAKKQLKEGFNA